MLTSLWNSCNLLILVRVKVQIFFHDRIQKPKKLILSSTVYSWNYLWVTTWILSDNVSNFFNSDLPSVSQLSIEPPTLSQNSLQIVINLTSVCFLLVNLLFFSFLIVHLILLLYHLLVNKRLSISWLICVRSRTEIVRLNWTPGRWLGTVYLKTCRRCFLSDLSMPCHHFCQRWNALVVFRATWTETTR